MSIFGPKKGSWSVESKTDPQWNNSGRGYGLVTSGGPPELHNWLKECTEKYGEPPDDTNWSFWKD